MKSTIAAGLAILLLGCSIRSVSAHTPSDPEAVGNIGRLATEANLIFRGQVTNVKYRNSPGGPNGARGVPYTFVTFSVSSVLRGSSPGKNITLRFVGGADGRGGFVEAEGVPLFQVGDEDILFVAGNGEAGCPLVMCEFGRFRILNETVHEAHGSPVVSVEGGRVRAEGDVPSDFQTFRYPAPEFEELLRRPEFAGSIRSAGMTVAEARAWYEAEASGVVEIRAAEVKTEKAAAAATRPVQAVGVGAFMAAIGSAASADRQSPQQVRSINPDAPIVVPAPVASAPPPLPAGPAENVSPGRIIRKD